MGERTQQARTTQLEPKKNMTTRAGRPICASTDLFQFVAGTQTKGDEISATWLHNGTISVFGSKGDS